MSGRAKGDRPSVGVAVPGVLAVQQVALSNLPRSPLAMFQPDSGSTSTAVYVVLLSAVVFVYSRLRVLELKVSSVERLILNADMPPDVISRIEVLEADVAHYAQQEDVAADPGAQCGDQEEDPQLASDGESSADESEEDDGS